MSLEGLSEDDVKALAALAQSVSNNPKTRSALFTARAAGAAAREAQIGRAHV